MVHSICPACGGGRTRERSLHTFSANGLVTGKCYRASCGWYGRVDGPLAPQIECKVATSREPLRAEHEAWLVGRVGSVAASRLGAFSDGSRIGLPVLSPLGEDMGATLRAVSGSPKYLSVVQSRYNLGAWYGCHRSSVVLVEDQLSAVYCNTHVPNTTAVALLGHTVHKELAVYLAERNIKVLLALDPDARKQEVKNYLALRSILDIQLLAIPDDLKNLSIEDMTHHVVKA